MTQETIQMSHEAIYSLISYVKRSVKGGTEKLLYPCVPFYPTSFATLFCYGIDTPSFSISFAQI